MAAALSLDNVKESAAAQGSPAMLPLAATCLLLAGMVAAWLAAASVGLLGGPLRHALTWLSLSVAVLAEFAPAARTARNRIVLTAGLALGLFFTSFSSPVVNVLAVAVVLAALAQSGRGLAGRAAVLAAFAAFALGIFRLACDSIPAAWSAADAAGGALGRLAGWLSGYRFDVGASVAGLDFLVVAAAVYAGWIACTARATDVAGAAGRRATGSASATLAAVAALAGGQLGYLLLAANSQRLLSLLPPAAPSVLSGASHIGAWSWADGLRTLVCWNLPLAALLIHGTLVALVVRSGWWLPAAGGKGDRRLLPERPDQPSVGARCFAQKAGGSGDRRTLPERPDQPSVGARCFAQKVPVPFSALARGGSGKR